MKWWNRIKAFLQRLDEKQKNDRVKAERSYKEHECAYCGEVYKGNFCPQCGQSCEIKKASAKSMLAAFMDIWGMGSKSMFQAMKDLLWRPGYMIQDWLDGRTAAYFPPVKMLVILSIIYGATAYLIDAPIQPSRAAEELMLNFEEMRDTMTEEDVQKLDTPKGKAVLQGAIFIFKVKDWLQDHTPYLIIVQTLLLIFLIGPLFRRSPSRGTIHAGEAFFLQIYIACQMSLIAILFLLVTQQVYISEWYPYQLPSLLAFILLVYDYNQFFGFSLWRTALKTAAVSLIGMIGLIAVLFVVCIIAMAVSAVLSLL